MKMINSISRNKKEYMYNGARFWVVESTGNKLFECGVFTTSYGVVSFNNVKTLFDYKGVNGLTCEYDTVHRYETKDSQVYESIRITKRLYTVQKGDVINLSEETVFNK